MVWSLRLRGTLDRAALRAAFHDVVTRHETLRTVFPESGGVPHQRVLDAVDGMATVETGPGELPALLEDAGRRGFDLADEAPVRATLFGVAPDEHGLQVVVHHIAADGWSAAPLVRDLADAYGARHAGRAPAWHPLPVRYTDYALWQSDLLGEPGDPGSRLAAQVENWRKALDGLPPELPLPAARPRPAEPSHRGDVVRCSWDADRHRGLARLARDGHATLFMVLHAAFAALLTRLGAGTDIALGSPVAGRTDEALDDVVGLFVNTLVLRADTSGDPPFAELLARVRETDLAAYAHQDVPFDHLVAALSPDRSAGRHPLVQATLALQNAPSAGLVLPGLEVTPEFVTTGTARIDLFVSLCDRHTDGAPAGIDGMVEFSTDLFDPGTVQSLLDRWAMLVDAVLAAPGARIGDLDVMPAEERQRLLMTWSTGG